MMYTSHGHQILGTTAEEGPRPAIARCGGPGLCSACSIEAQAAVNHQVPNMVPSPIMRYFVYGHLPEKLQDVSMHFANLAIHVEETLPTGPEKSVALRKLLEAKDAAVRAALS